jgi:hypothetical protein
MSTASSEPLSGLQAELVRHLWAHGGAYDEMLSVVKRLYANGRTNLVFGTPLEQLRTLMQWNRRGAWRIHESEFWKVLPPPELTTKKENLLLVAFWETPLHSWQHYAAVIEPTKRTLLGFDTYMEMYSDHAEFPSSLLEWWRVPSQGAPLSVAQAVDRAELPSHVLAASLAHFALR